MTQVFISYSRKDLAFVEQLASDLEDAGLNVWYDLSDLEGGSRWSKEIEKAIRESQYVLVVLSPDSVASKWVEEEFLFAGELKKKIIPLFYRQCDIPFGYRTLHFIDIQRNKYQRNFGEISRALGGKSIKKKIPTHRIWDLQKTIIFAALIGLVLVAVFGLPPLLVQSEATPEPTLIPIKEVKPEPNNTATVTIIVNPSSTPTNPPPPTMTFTPEPGYTIVDKNEVMNVTSGLKTLGELANETYSTEERNKINNTLAFTIEASSDTSMLWRWYWCAVNQTTLNQNIKEVNVTFTIEDQRIPSEKISEFEFENDGGSYDGWKCRAYETVLTDWEPGTYDLIQTVTLKSIINDGEDTFPSGYKTYKYTVTIFP